MSNQCNWFEKRLALFCFVLLVYQNIQLKGQRSDPYISACTLPHVSLTQRRVRDFSDHVVKNDTPFTPSTNIVPFLGQTSAEIRPCGPMRHRINETKARDSSVKWFSCVIRGVKICLTNPLEESK
jgi:hypothetical protein